MTATDVAARLTDLAAELRARAKNVPGCSLSDAQAELRAAGVRSGTINLDVPTSELPLDWSVWDGTAFYRAPTLSGAMAAWRASRGVRTQADAERVVAPLLADDAVVPLFDGVASTASEPATTVLG